MNPVSAKNIAKYLCELSHFIWDNNFIMGQQSHERVFHGLLDLGNYGIESRLSNLVTQLINRRAGTHMLQV